MRSRILRSRADPSRRRVRASLAAAIAIAAASLVPAGPDVAVTLPASPAIREEVGLAGVAKPALPVRPAGDGPPVTSDPNLTRDLDAVIGLSPAGSCLSVAINKTPVYRHNQAHPVIPASTEKLFTAAAALDRLGRDHRFITRVVAAKAPANGTVVGDLVLVGGGDPQLTTSIYQAVRKLSASRPRTLLDDLATKVAAAGVKHVTGRVLGDESRYDAARVVASWPERYVRQDQSGPLSALDVDDGYTLRPGENGFVRDRAENPAAAAAMVFTDLLRAKGVQVDGEATAGPASVGAKQVASIDSAPLQEVLADMLRYSDNQTAELVAKELGRVDGKAGTTAAGAAVIAKWRAEHDLAPSGTLTVDGSGLDPANRVTCDELTAVLDLDGGRTGQLAAGLPVAAKSGTLVSRFRGSPAAGRLRAKTGRLNSVTALAGFVDLPEGATATFAYVANGEPVTSKVRAAQDFLVTVLARYLAPCPASTAPPMVVAPVSTYAASGAIVAVPLAAIALPATLTAVDVFAREFRSISDRCTAGDPGATIVFDP